MWPLKEPEHSFATVLNDRNGNLLGAIIAQDGQWRFPIPDSIPNKIEQCILHFEDQYFFQHPGINPVSILRAAYQNTRNGKVVSGASTITMQLARMMENKNRNLYQKVVESLIALKLEMKYSKSTILRKYLAIAPFGGNVVGIETASWRYFERPSHLLSWGEAASLAVLPNNPGAIFPGNSEVEFKLKRDRLLKKLFKNEVIDSLTYELSLLEDLPSGPYPIPQKASHLLHTARKIKRGEFIQSTLDRFWQSKTTEVIERFHRDLKTNSVENIAAVVIDLKSSEILAYVGNTNDPAADGNQVDIIQKPRSPGSSLKPILYAYALDKGVILKNSLLPDIPTFFGGFSPKNFSGGYEGAVAADEALVKSLNIPMTYLLKDYTYEQFHYDLKQLGFSTLVEEPGHYGLSLILGGAEVTLWDLSNAYIKLFQQLKYGESWNISYLQSEKKKAYLSIDPKSIWQTFQAMTELSRPSDEAQWKKYKSSQLISWKTGTSFGFRDAWAVGLNGDIFVGVWVGNADGEGRPGLTGIQVAAPVFLELINLGDHDKDWLDQLKPLSFQKVGVCSTSGMLGSPYCPIKESEVGDHWQNTELCPYHHQVFLDKSGHYRVNSSCYDMNQMVKVHSFSLPPSMGYYYSKSHPDYSGAPPFLDTCKTNFSNPIEIIYPNNKSEIYIPKELNGENGEVVLEASHRNINEKLFWTIDDKFFGSTTNEHRLSVFLNKGQHQLILCDAQGNELARNFSVISDHH